jgi:hypothetical protein
VPEEKRAEVAAAVGAVKSGPLGANAVPSHVPGPDGQLMPFNPLQDVAFHALSHAYSIGFLVCGIAALLAAVIAATMLGGRKQSNAFAEREMIDPR